jgi:anti-sigma B factor antagonist
MSITNNVIRPVGILDGTSLEELGEQVQQILQGTSPVILIDLQETTFIDSSGLGALVSTLKSVRAANRKLYFCAPNAQIKMVFELSGMDQAFEIFESRDAFEQEMLSLTA